MVESKMEFFKHIRSYIVIFIFFGLWTSIEHFKYKQPLRICLAFSLISLFCLFSFTLYSNPFYTFTTISNTVANSLFWLFMLTHLAIVLESISQRKAQTKIIKKFTFVDQLFKTMLNITFPYRQERREILIIIVTSASVISSIMVAVCVYSYSTYSTGFTFHFMYSTWIIRLRIIQVIFFVCLLRNRLNLINHQLKNIPNIWNTQDDGEDRTQIFRMLLNLKRIYGKLFDICELINRAFGLSLLAVMTHSFIDFTSDCYWMYLAKQDYGKIWFFASAQIQIAIILSSLAHYCSTCYHEVRV